MAIEKKIIFNADDFGISKTINDAIIEGIENGVLSSTSLIANAPFFDDAVSKFKQLKKTVDLGVHLNIFEFKALQQPIKKNSPLYDKNGFFRQSFLQMLINSYNENFLLDVEKEFRLQIEKISQHFEISHIDSHVHIHSISNIFKIVCKLAKEYKIEFVRTQYEKPYISSDLKKIFSLNYPLNMTKLCILNFFTILNRKTLKQQNLKTNDNFIGVNYTGNMNLKTIQSALKTLESKKLTELIMHPDTNQKRKRNFEEYLAITDKNLFEYIKKENANIHLRRENK